MDATKKGKNDSRNVSKSVGVQVVSQDLLKGKVLLLFLPKSGGSISPPAPGSDGLGDETVVCGVIPKFPFVGIILSTMFPPTKRSYVCWPPSKFTMLRFDTISSGGNVVTVSIF